jgi:hypothetical protein
VQQLPVLHALSLSRQTQRLERHVHSKLVPELETHATDAMRLEPLVEGLRIEAITGATLMRRSACFIERILFAIVGAVKYGVMIALRAAQERRLMLGDGPTMSFVLTNDYSA